MLIQHKAPAGELVRGASLLPAHLSTQPSAQPGGRGDQMHPCPAKFAFSTDVRIRYQVPKGETREDIWATTPEHHIFLHPVAFSLSTFSIPLTLQ